MSTEPNKVIYSMVGVSKFYDKKPVLIALTVFPLLPFSIWRRHGSVCVRRSGGNRAWERRIKATRTV
jgi:hypothetical protein